MDDQVIVRFQHSRVADGRLNPRKGKPKGWILQPYSRKNGWVNNEDPVDHFVDPRGGLTKCIIEIWKWRESETPQWGKFEEEAHVIGTGTALCSFSQNFSYWEGRRISQNRAIDIAILNGYADAVRDAGLSKLYYQDAAQNQLPDGSTDMLDLEL